MSRWKSIAPSKQPIIIRLESVDSSWGLRRNRIVNCSGTRKNKEKITLRFQRKAMHIRNEDLIWFSHATQKGRYTRRTLPTLYRGRCAVPPVYFVWTCMRRKYGQIVVIHMRVARDFIKEYRLLRVYVLNFLKIFHEVVNIWQTWLRIGEFLRYRIPYTVYAKVPWAKQDNCEQSIFIVDLFFIVSRCWEVIECRGSGIDEDQSRFVEAIRDGHALPARRYSVVDRFGFPDAVHLWWNMSKKINNLNIEVRHV